MRFDDLEVMDFNTEDDILKEEMSLEEESGCEDRAEDKTEDRTKRKRRKKKQEDDDDKVNWVKELKSVLSTVLITVVVVFLLKSYVIINATVPTGSMENTILPGDNILGFRMAYLMEEPQRGDVIFFYFPDDETWKYVKRIIGLPGEKVYINDAKIYINGSEIPLEEPYLKEEWIAGIGPYEFDVPEGCYFVLGDNRNGSADARYWKNPYVAEEKIIGKAIFTYYPFDRWGFVE